MAHIVSISPSSLTTRYEGIIPPLKNIVTTIIPVKNFFPENVLRDSGNAHKQDIMMLISVPTTVYSTEFHKDRKSCGSLVIDL